MLSTPSAVGLLCDPGAPSANDVIRSSREQDLPRTSHMSVVNLLGHSVKLTIRRFGSPGAFLAVDEQDDRPMPRRSSSSVPRSPRPRRANGSMSSYTATPKAAPSPPRAPPKLTLGEVAAPRGHRPDELRRVRSTGGSPRAPRPFAQQTRGRGRRRSRRSRSLRRRRAASSPAPCGACGIVGEEQAGSSALDK